MFYGVVNVALVTAFVVYAHNMRKQQRHMKLNCKEFLLSIAGHLVTSFAAQRYKFPRLSRKIKEAIILCGFAPDSHESTVQNTEDKGYRAIAKKRGRLSFVLQGKRCKDPVCLQIVCTVCLQGQYEHDHYM